MPDEYQDSYEKKFVEYLELIDANIRRMLHLERMGCLTFGLALGQVLRSVYLLCRDYDLDAWRWVLFLVNAAICVWTLVIMNGVAKRLVVLRTLLRSAIGFHQAPIGSNVQLHHAEQFQAAIEAFGSKIREDTHGNESKTNT
jgi:MFS family permease